MSDKHSKIIRNKRENRREKEMKNKIISAMLVGMSATMAVPVTAVMAAEGEPTATEATAAEAAVTEETQHDFFRSRNLKDFPQR